MSETLWPRMGHWWVRRNNQGGCHLTSGTGYNDDECNGTMWPNRIKNKDIYTKNKYKRVTLSGCMQHDWPKSHPPQRSSWHFACDQKSWISLRKQIRTEYQVDHERSPLGTKQQGYQGWNEYQTNSMTKLWVQSSGTLALERSSRQTSSVWPKKNMWVYRRKNLLAATVSTPREE